MSDTLFHLLYGRHSGIPLCCCVAFIRQRASDLESSAYARCARCVRLSRHSPLHACDASHVSCRFFLRWITRRNLRSVRRLLQNGWRQLTPGEIASRMPGYVFDGPVAVLENERGREGVFHIVELGVEP